MNNITHIENSGNLAAEAFGLFQAMGAISMSFDMTERKVEFHFMAEEFMQLGLEYEVEDHVCEEIRYRATAKFDQFNIFCLLTYEQFERYVSGKAVAAQ